MARPTVDMIKSSLEDQDPRWGRSFSFPSSWSWATIAFVIFGAGLPPPDSFPFVSWFISMERPRVSTHLSHSATKVPTLQPLVLPPPCAPQCYFPSSSLIFMVAKILHGSNVPRQCLTFKNTTIQTIFNFNMDPLANKDCQVFYLIKLCTLTIYGHFFTSNVKIVRKKKILQIYSTNGIPRIYNTPVIFW